jgi:hypothetical protein
MVYASGDVYEGEWQYSLRGGKGKLKLAGGTTLEGIWEGDALSG